MSEQRPAVDIKPSYSRMVSTTSTTSVSYNIAGNQMLSLNIKYKLWTNAVNRVMDSEHFPLLFGRTDATILDIITTTYNLYYYLVYRFRKISICFKFRFLGIMLAFLIGPSGIYRIAFNINNRHFFWKNINFLDEENYKIAFYFSILLILAHFVI